MEDVYDDDGVMGDDGAAGLADDDRELDLCCIATFQLLHFHLGSQISSIRSLKSAMREAGRFFVELVKLGAQKRCYSRLHESGSRQGRER